VDDTQQIIPQFQTALAALFYDTDTYGGWLETMIAVGELTGWYQNCYNGSVDSLFDLYYFILKYESVTNYLVFWLLNLVVQAITMVQNIRILERAILEEDEEEVIYMYAYFFKIYFFYEYDPDQMSISMLYAVP